MLKKRIVLFCLILVTLHFNSICKEGAEFSGLNLGLTGSAGGVIFFLENSEEDEFIGNAREIVNPIYFNWKLGMDLTYGFKNVYTSLFSDFTINRIRYDRTSEIFQNYISESEIKEYAIQIGLNFGGKKALGKQAGPNMYYTTSSVRYGLIGGIETTIGRTLIVDNLDRKDEMGSRIGGFWGVRLGKFFDFLPSRLFLEFDFRMGFYPSDYNYNFKTYNMKLSFNFIAQFIVLKNLLK